jgi:hypothetical protein
MSETPVGAPARDRQQDLRKRLVERDLPEEREIQSQLQAIARDRADEATVPHRGFLSRLFRRG